MQSFPWLRFTGASVGREFSRSPFLPEPCLILCRLLLMPPLRLSPHVGPMLLVPCDNLLLSATPMIILSISMRSSFSWVLNNIFPVMTIGYLLMKGAHSAGWTPIPVGTSAHILGILGVIPSATTPTPEQLYNVSNSNSASFLHVASFCPSSWLRFRICILPFFSWLFRIRHGTCGAFPCIYHNAL